MRIEELIKSELSKPNYILKIEDKTKGLKLRKESATKFRYAFTLSDIITEFQSVENLLNVLRHKGFGKTSFIFSQIYDYDNTTTYRLMKTVEHTINTIPQYQTPTPNYGGTQNTGVDIIGMGTPQNINMLGALVNSERLNDLREENRELKEEIKDYRSENRRLKEENHNLKLKVETSEERANLKVQSELLNKKGFLDKMAENPTIVEKLAGLGIALATKGETLPSDSAPTGMSLPPIYEQFINRLDSSTELTKKLVGELLKRNNDELNNNIINLIKNG